MKKAIIYLRNENKFKMYNDEVERELRDFIATLPNVKVTGVYVDVYDDDENEMNRDIVSKIFSSAKNGDFQIIVTNDMSGLMHNHLTPWCIVDELNKLRINIISKTSAILEKEKQSQLIMQLVDKWYAEDRREKLAKRKQEKLAKMANGIQ